MIKYDDLSDDEKAVTPSEAIATSRRATEHIGQHKALHTQAAVLAKCLAVLEHHHGTLDSQRRGKRNG